MVKMNFNAHQVAPWKPWEPVPAGWYKVTITESEMKQTHDGQGAYLMLTMSIVEGEHTDKIFIVRLNVQNYSQRAVDMAYGELSAICHVIGMYEFTDTSELYDKEFQVKAVVKETTDERGNIYLNNEIKGYKDIYGNDPGKQKQQAPAAFGDGQVASTAQPPIAENGSSKPTSGATPTPSPTDEIPAWAK